MADGIAGLEVVERFYLGAEGNTFAVAESSGPNGDWLPNVSEIGDGWYLLNQTFPVDGLWFARLTSSPEGLSVLLEYDILPTTDAISLKRLSAGQVMQPSDYNQVLDAVESLVPNGRLPGGTAGVPGPQGPLGPEGPEGPQGASSLAPDEIMTAAGEIILGNELGQPVPRKYSDLTWYSIKDPRFAGGAKGDGVTDDSDAFEAAADFMIAQRRVTSEVSGTSLRLGKVGIYVPSGDYIITRANCFLKAPPERSAGVMFMGDGLRSSTIIYKPASSATHPYMVRNEEISPAAGGWLSIVISDIGFISDTAGASCFSQKAWGGPKWIYFNRCYFKDWTHVVHVTGVDCPYIFFNECFFQGTFNEILRLEEHDNNLDYQFNRCSFWIDSGTIIHAVKGGMIYMTGCDVILSPNTPGPSHVAILDGDSHAGGAQSFSLRDTRIEIHKTGCTVMQSQWGQGTIVFDNVDMSSYVASSPGWTITPTDITARFDHHNQGGAMVTWRNCQTRGRHEYTYGNAYERQGRVLYEMCQSMDQEGPNDLIITTAKSGALLGGVPKIEFKTCRSNLNYRLWDSTINWQIARLGITTRKVASLKNSNGAMPAGGGIATLILPLNSVVERYRVYIPPFGVSNSTTWQLVLRDGQGSPVTLFTFGPGTQLKLGYDTGWVNISPLHICNTQEKATLTLTSNAALDSTTTGALILVEYIS